MNQSSLADPESHILIGGSPNSGSTLLSIMIDSHPKMFCGPETNIIAHPGMWRNEKSLSTYFDLDTTPDALKSGITWARPSPPGLDYHLVPLSALKMATPQFSSPLEALSYIMKPRLTMENKQVAFEKSPPNIYAIIPALERHPSLKAIVTVRNAQDVIRSLLRRKSTLRGAVIRWLSKLNLCYQASQRFGPDRVLVIKYEELVRDPLSIAQAVCKFSGVDLKAAKQMVKCKNSRRLESDPTIGGISGASSYWQFQPGDPISDGGSHQEKDILPDTAIELLNQTKLSDSALTIFGGNQAALNAAEVSEAFGYPIDWDVTKGSGYTICPVTTKNRLYAFCESLLEEKDPKVVDR